MFDIGFWEICLIALVSLIVIGPEKLPKVARVAGFWVGKTRNMVAAVKTEIKEDLQAEEMRQILKEQANVEEFQQMLKESNETVKQMASSVENKNTSKQTDDTK